jgi:aminopeptidase N
MISSRLRLSLIIAAMVLVFTVLAASAVVLWGVYYRYWDGPVVTTLADALPIPAAKVGDRTILLRSYLKDLRSLERFLSSEAALAQNQKRAVTVEDKKSVLDRLVQEAAVAEVADARGIRVEPEQEAAVMEEMQITSTSTADFIVYISENYGWTMDDFTSHVVHPVILTRLLTASFAADHAGDPQAFEAYMDERTKREDVVWYLQF